jgi:GTPase involved in cell partitioning and DNA repair
VLIVFLLSIIIYLFTSNSRIKEEHAKNIQKLQDLIQSLHYKQKLLNDKVIISNQYDTTYSKDMKALGDEVVELQKVFIDIISNRNYN